MKLSSLLTMISVVSALSFGSAEASAKSKSHSSKTHSSKSHSSTKSSTQKAEPPAPSAADSEQAAAPALSQAQGRQTRIQFVQNTLFGLSAGSILVLLALGD